MILLLIPIPELTYAPFFDCCRVTLGIKREEKKMKKETRQKNDARQSTVNRKLKQADYNRRMMKDKCAGMNLSYVAYANDSNAFVSHSEQYAVYSYLHRQHVIHHDLKPANIYLVSIPFSELLYQEQEEEEEESEEDEEKIRRYKADT